MINRPPVNLHISINHSGLIRTFIAMPSSRNNILVIGRLKRLFRQLFCISYYRRRALTHLNV